jgi:hypothetical protein
MNGYCAICGKDIEIKMCCSGINRDCGCMGQPIEPPVCCDECHIKFIEMLESKKVHRPNVKTTQP